ncbi:MAG: type I polyketide synthase, partial [Deltaproteobacteria bacterium]|nr:type I polyketide synthase [Deltaproteobacteria bacterium]MBW2536570.1 type I polyketide synthase [Deltaproteobacteria bacterium]
TKHHFCGIGSVKTNIGHLESAAGIASLVKVVLAMEHERIPPTLHCESVSPYVDLTDSPFRIVRELQPWERPTDGQGAVLPRRAGVSSFGVGGANAHVVVEEHRSDGAQRDAAGTGQPELVVLSAKNEERLRAYAERLARFVDQAASSEQAAGHLRGPLRLDDLAFTLQRGRDAMEERLALVAETLPELGRRLAAFGRGDEGTDGIVRGTVKRGKKLDELDTAVDDRAADARQALEDRDLAALAELWTTGTEIPWEALPRERSPRRIPLPTYPFLRRRCWVGEKGR